MTLDKNQKIAAYVAATLVAITIVYYGYVHVKNKKSATTKTTTTTTTTTPASKYEGKLVNAVDNGAIYFVDKGKLRIVSSDDWTDYFNYGANKIYGDWIKITPEELAALPMGDQFVAPKTA